MIEVATLAHAVNTLSLSTRKVRKLPRTFSLMKV